MRARGVSDLIGSRDTLRQAFRLGLIVDGEGWMQMVQDRNLTSHTDNQARAEQIAANIQARHLHCFGELRRRLSELEAQGGTLMVGSGSEIENLNSSPALAVIPELSEGASGRLLAVLAAEPAVRQVWLYGSRAMGTQRSGSDIDLTLVGETLEHRHLLQLLGVIDELLLPWSVDLCLHAELSDDLREHIRRVGRPLALPGR